MRGPLSLPAKAGIGALLVLAGCVGGYAYGAGGGDPAPAAADVPVSTADVPSPIPTPLAGTYLVGVDLAPGVYQGTATGDCYVERTEAGGSIIDNDLFEAGDRVTFVVAPTDYAVSISRGCGLSAA